MIDAIRIARITTVVCVLMPACVAHATDPVFEPVLPMSPSATTDAGYDTAPAAATDGAGTWVVAWSSNDTLNGTIDTDFDILFSRSTDRGVTFTAEAALNTNAATDTELFYGRVAGVHDQAPALAADAAGSFIAVWQREPSVAPSNIAMARSDDHGATWTPPAMLFDESLAPAIATDCAGTWVIVWEKYKANLFSEIDVYFTRSTDNGTTWTPPAPLNINAAIDRVSDLRPHIYWSGGVWVVAFNAQTFPPMDAIDAGVWSARSLDGGATWSTPAALGPPSYGLWHQEPKLASDGVGGWVAVWSVLDLSTQDSDLLAARSSDNAATWSAPAPLNDNASTSGRRNIDPYVAAGAPGTFVALWTGGVNSQGSVLTATSTDGSVSWSAMHPIFTTPAGPQDAPINNPLIAHDPAGHWLAFWATNDETIASGTKGKDYDVVMSLADYSCGNGVLDPGEECDDGDRGSLDCCGRTCTLDPVDTVCAADADPCTLERCDGAGTCGHRPAPLGTRCADDADLCTFDRCDGAGACEHVLERHLDCRDALRPQSSKLQIKSGGDPAAQTLSWKWNRGPATTVGSFALYIWGEDYALCVFDDSGLLMRADAPAGACAGGAQCWRATATRMKYTDIDATPDGVTSLILKAGRAGKTSMKLAGKGANLALPSLPLASAPVYTQLMSADHGCWTATYSGAGVKVNTGSVFSAKSD